MRAGEGVCIKVQKGVFVSRRFQKGLDGARRVFKGIQGSRRVEKGVGVGNVPRSCCSGSAHARPRRRFEKGSKWAQRI